MKAIARINLIWFVFFTTSFFYFVGASRFPDFENYLRIAENSGFVVSENDYWFEWLSRFILSLNSISPLGRVELLAALNQIVCVTFFGWIALKSKPKHVFGGLILFCLCGFLLMTTTLRASAAYLSIAAFFLRRGRLDFSGLFLLLFALAWHDSAAPVVLVCLIASGVAGLVSKYRQNLSLTRPLTLVVLVSITITLSAESLRPLLAGVDVGDIGVRAAYFDGDVNNTLAKTLFVVFGILSCLLCIRDPREINITKIYLALITMVVAIFYVISPVAAVRFCFYIFTVVLPLRGSFFSDFENRSEMRILALLLSPVVFYLSCILTLSNTI